MSEAKKEITEQRFFSDQLMMELGQAVVQKDLVTREQIDQLNMRRTLTGETLDGLLVKESLVSETAILERLAALTGIPFGKIADYTVSMDAVGKMPARIALRYGAMPLKLEGGIITLAVSQVPQLSDADSLRILLNMAVEWVLCTETDITKSIKHFYGLGAETIDNLYEAPPEDEVQSQGTDIVDTTEEGIIRFVNQIIHEAITLEATDIHIEPFENSLRLRYRVDGLLQDIPVPKGVTQLRRAIASCVKIMAEMDIAERRKPHDGRITVRCGADEYDLRVSILPTSHGETVNMRILNRNSMFIDLEHLGLNTSEIPKIEYLSTLPHGVTLLTGPTGSGKTTTLYAMLSRISTDDVKIITVEDPIEYQIHGVNQIQVHAKIGVTFASVLRSILRHDPDIILIGEIRDMETADIAMRASLTGHLVFSTLHTNDAPSAIARLVDMGVEPYLVSSCLEGVIAQRLVRRACESCREEIEPDDVVLEEIADLFPEKMKDAKFFKGHGCPNCNFTGYKGRIALCEIMILDDALRGLIVHQRPANEIRDQAITTGLITLRRAGWGRVLEGITTIDEVIRVARKIERK
jgi:type II secretory ATPase GspE/PulE/Tfp pilus assembly ATPase PilB-like protein